MWASVGMLCSESVTTAEGQWCVYDIVWTSTTDLQCRVLCAVSPFRASTPTGSPGRTKLPFCSMCQMPLSLLWAASSLQRGLEQTSPSFSAWHQQWYVRTYVHPYDNHMTVTWPDQQWWPHTRGKGCVSEGFNERECLEACIVTRWWMTANRWGFRLVCAILQQLVSR